MDKITIDEIARAAGGETMNLVDMRERFADEIGDLVCWDNEESIDRYTVVWPDGMYLGMNAAPFHPQGFGQHGEGAQHDPDVEEMGDRMKSYLGWLIEFDDLPPDCQRCVIRDLIQEQAWGVVEDMKGDARLSWLLQLLGSYKATNMAAEYITRNIPLEDIEVILHFTTECCAKARREAMGQGQEDALKEAIDHLFELLGIDPEMAWQAITFAMEEEANGG